MDENFLPGKSAWPPWWLLDQKDGMIRQMTSAGCAATCSARKWKRRKYRRIFSWQAIWYRIAVITMQSRILAGNNDLKKKFNFFKGC